MCLLPETQKKRKESFKRENSAHTYTHTHIHFEQYRFRYAKFSYEFRLRTKVAPEKLSAQRSLIVSLDCSFSCIKDFALPSSSPSLRSSRAAVKFVGLNRRRNSSRRLDRRLNRPKLHRNFFFLASYTR